MADKALISIVSPCFNEAEVIEAFYVELRKVLDGQPEYAFEIILVDDGSTDETLARLNALAERDDRLRIYSLSRNFGHQLALSAGLDVARGDAVVMLDSDLQHPPSLIPKMIELWQSGHDVVSTVRQDTADAGVVKRTTSRMFYYVFNSMSETTLAAGAADFCLLSRKAHGALRRMPERHRFLRGMITWMGFRRTYVPYVAAARAAGVSKYTMTKMVRFAMDATFSFSAKPIKLATRAGITVTLAGLAYLIYVLAASVFLADRTAKGWPSLISTVLILGGMQMTFIGVIGEYIARMFEEMKGRPLYIFKQTPPPEKNSEEARPDVGAQETGGDLAR